MICIYHSRDLDGWCSAAIVKKKFGNIKLLGWDYGDPIPSLKDLDGHKIVMVDISFPKDDMDKINSYFSIQWIDHHISAINEMRGLNIAGMRDTHFSACELTWKYLFPDQEMPEFVRLLGRYDCFGHKNTHEEQKVLEFQYAARAYFKNPEDCYEAITSWDSMTTNQWNYINPLLEKGKGIYNYLCTEAEQDYKDKFDLRFVEMDGKITNTRKFACVNKKRFNPINFGINYHEDGYDGFACFHYANGMYNFSLYNDNGEVDCSVIAKQLGGGGHKGASGFGLNETSFKTLIHNG